jgi:hypothetical protein
MPRPFKGKNNPSKFLYVAVNSTHFWLIKDFYLLSSKRTGRTEAKILRNGLVVLVLLALKLCASIHAPRITSHGGKLDF